MPRLAGHRHSVETENRQRKALLRSLDDAKSTVGDVVWFYESECSMGDCSVRLLPESEA